MKKVFDILKDVQPMNLKDLNESDLLDLLDKTEQEQDEFFVENELYKGRRYRGELAEFSRMESIPDLAERLWKKARSTEGCDLLQSLCDVSGVLEKRVTCDKCGHESSEGDTFFWATDADAIHRIVAALLALKRSDVEEI